MLAEQRKRNEAVIEARRCEPRELRVAAVAARPELTAMRILAVTRRAVAPELDVDAGRVTTGALELGMRAAEREVRHTGMIEARFAPLHRVVAPAARCAQTPLMRIVAAVTALAGRRQRRGQVADVTGLASDLLVGTA